MYTKTSARIHVFFNYIYRPIILGVVYRKLINFRVFPEVLGIVTLIKNVENVSVK